MRSHLSPGFASSLCHSSSALCGAKQRCCNSHGFWLPGPRTHRILLLSFKAQTIKSFNSRFFPDSALDPYLCEAEHTAESASLHCQHFSLQTSAPNQARGPRCQRFSNTLAQVHFPVLSVGITCDIWPEAIVPVVPFSSDGYTVVSSSSPFHMQVHGK